MIKLSHTYTFTPDWQYAVADQLGLTLHNDRMLLLSEDLGEGGSYFSVVVPGLSVLLVDIKFNKSLTIQRRSVEQDDMYIAYFDLSKDPSTYVVAGVSNKMGYNSKLNMALMNAGQSSEVLTPKDSEMFGIRLLIDKKLLIALAEEAGGSDVSNWVLAAGESIYYYGHMDSKSILLMNDLKRANMKDVSFEFLLRGMALHLLYHLIDRGKDYNSLLHKMSSQDVKEVEQATNYLLTHLLDPFPGVEFLVSLTSMSVSKFKILFKQALGMSPNQYFVKEKLRLAESMLLSGTYRNVNEVAYELGYNKPGHFAYLYKRLFDARPSDVFIRKSCW